jgi:hypothetical protein
MRIHSQQDFWSGLMFLVVGLGFALASTRYPLGAAARPGPGYFPLGLGLILAIFGAIVLFKSLTKNAPDGEPIGVIVWRPIAWIIGSVVIFGFALPWLGMIVALPLLVFTSSLAGDEFKWREVLINMVVLTAGSWLIFIKGLALVIPLWPAFVVS